MSAGDIAAIVAAAAFVLLVGLAAVPMLKLGRTLDEATLAIRKAHDGAGPILTEAQTTVTDLNAQLKRMDGITASAESVTSNAAALTSLFASSVGGPLVRIAAFSHGIRRASANRRRTALKRQDREARKSARGRHSRGKED